MLKHAFDNALVNRVIVSYQYVEYTFQLSPHYKANPALPVAITPGGLCLICTVWLQESV